MTPGTNGRDPFTWSSLQPALPEIYLTAAICVLLMADVFFGDRRRGLAPTLTLLILVAGAAITALYANVGERVLLFGDSYVTDPLAVVLKLFGFVTIALALLYSREYLERRGMMRGEYYVLALTASSRHLRHGLGQQPAHRVHRRRAHVAVALCHGGVRPRLGPGGGIGDEVLRARRHRLGNVVVRHVADLRPQRHDQPRRSRREGYRRAQRRRDPRAGVHGRRRWRSSSAPCRFTCGCRTFTAARPRP